MGWDVVKVPMPCRRTVLLFEGVHYSPVEGCEGLVAMVIVGFDHRYRRTAVTVLVPKHILGEMGVDIATRAAADDWTVREPDAGV
ncbi:MAG: hypothetical protein KatS3mg014_2434 [Actinomycetota bacterium]|nr:MAG: hypothetical protein KatS3mg014_2434 [Actinomycetota bacterium]